MYLFCNWKYRLPFIVQTILSLWISAKDLNIPVQFRQLSFSFLQVPVFCGCQLGDYFPNQVASTKILAAMAPKVVTAWRVVIPSRSVVVRNIIWNKLCRIRFVYDLFFFFFFAVSFLSSFFGLFVWWLFNIRSLFFSIGLFPLWGQPLRREVLQLKYL